MLIVRVHDLVPRRSSLLGADNLELFTEGRPPYESMLASIAAAHNTLIWRIAMRSGVITNLPRAAGPQSSPRIAQADPHLWPPFACLSTRLPHRPEELRSLS